MIYITYMNIQYTSFLNKQTSKRQSIFPSFTLTVSVLRWLNVSLSFWGCFIVSENSSFPLSVLRTDGVHCEVVGDD